MSADPPPELPRVKSRLPFQARTTTGATRRTAAAVYGVVSAGLAILAVYMAGAEHHPLTSPYVIAPAVGAVWFGLRLFMTMGPRL